MRHVLAILFLVIFSLQVVPAKSIGKLLCKQLTEDIQADHVDEDNNMANLDVVCYADIILSRHSFDPVAATRHLQVKVSVMLNSAVALPNAFVSSIPTPPPDFI